MIVILKITIFIKYGDFLDIHVFFNQDKKFKIDMVINNLSSEAFHVFFSRGKSLVNLNLHCFLAGREDNMCRY